MTLRPMLATDCPPSRVNEVLTVDRWVMQSKVDGRRLIVSRIGDTWSGVGRDGQAVAIPDQLVTAGLADIPGDFMLDGELLGSKSKASYHVFDVLLLAPMVSYVEPLATRLEVLNHLFKLLEPGPSLQLLPVAHGTGAKADLVERVRAAHGEGVVAKDIDAGYTFPTRPSERSTAWFKLKFRSDVDCVITDRNRDSKANFVLSCVEDGELVEVGEVSALTGDGPRITKAIDAGELELGRIVVTVIALYSSDNRRLVQPVKPILRTDKAPGECGIDQVDAIRTDKTALT